MPKGTLSVKAVVIVETITRGAPNGDFLDLDQLLEALPYETTKQSLQFSIRSLIKRGFIEKKPAELRRGRMRRVLAPTVNAVTGTDKLSGSFDTVVEGEEDE